MDGWESLGSPEIIGKELFWDLSFAEAGGDLWLRLPGVKLPGSISLGVGANDATPPTQLYFKKLKLELHSQVMKFEIPPFLKSLKLGVRFEGSIEQIDVHFLFLKMGLVTLEKVQIPLVDSSEFKAPIEADYERFRFPHTNEVFVKHDDTYWRGMLREDYKSFKSVVSSDPLAELDDPDLQPAGTLVPSFQQGYWTGLSVQNDSQEEQTIALMVITDEGEVLKEVVTLNPGQIKPIVSAKTSEETGRVHVYAVSETEVPLTLNIYYNSLLAVAPSTN